MGCGVFEEEVKAIFCPGLEAGPSLWTGVGGLCPYFELSMCLQHKGVGQGPDQGSRARLD